MKNDINDITTVLVNPKYNPRPPISFTSPSPTESFPNISLLSKVININIPIPAIIPSSMFIVIAVLDTPYKNAIISPVSKIVKLNLFGIICNL